MLVKYKPQESVLLGVCMHADFHSSDAATGDMEGGEMSSPPQDSDKVRHTLTGEQNYSLCLAAAGGQ